MTIYADKFYKLAKFLERNNKGLLLEDIVEGLTYDTYSQIFSFYPAYGKEIKYRVLDVQERAAEILNDLGDIVGDYFDRGITNQQIIDWVTESLCDGADTTSVVGGREVERKDGFYIYEMD